MKKTIRLITLSVTLVLLSIPVAAKSLASELQDGCTTENKEAYYAQFLQNRNTDQAKAYEIAKKYLACPADGATEAIQKIIDYLKKWTTAYEDAKLEQDFTQYLYVKPDYKKAYEIGRTILAKKPDNLKVVVDMGVNGYLVATLKDPALNNEALNYARQALTALDSGKTVEKWEPLTGKDDAVAYLNYTIGYLTLEKDPAGSLKNLIKAAQFETQLKKSPYTFAYIAGAYEAGPYAKMSEAYKTTYGGKDETPESKLALANINQIVDRMIDGYARAVATAGADPKFAEAKKVWQESLSTWYKYRNNNQETGMNEMVASILTKPLPPEPTPLTSLPAAPAATPAATTGTPGAATNGAAATTTAASSTGSAKPAPKPTPGGPNKPR